MKKTKSIFFKIALYMTPIVLALDMFVLLLSYNIVYESNQHYCEKQIRNAASSAAKMAEGMDLKEDVTQKFLCEYFSELCGMYDITYLFIVEPDLVKNSETYLIRRRCRSEREGDALSRRHGRGDAQRGGDRSI